MFLKDLVKGINEALPFAIAEDFDNVGILCGDLEREVTGILVAHDVLEFVVDEAIEKKANVIISFHPIIFSALKSITGKNYVERVVLKAIENKISIIAIHTVLDNHFFGVNHRILKELGVNKQHVLIPKKGQLLQLSVYVPKNHLEIVKENLFIAGAGSLGFYDQCSFSLHGEGTFRPQENANPFIGKVGERESVDEVLLSVIFESFKEREIVQKMKEVHPYEEVAYQIYRLENENQYLGLGQYGDLEQEMTETEFLNLLKEKFNLRVVRYSQFSGRTIKKIGVIGGSGAQGIKNAIDAKCDAYITGDLKYHDFFRAENKLLLCDIGHFESEQFVVEQIIDILSKKFPKFAILKLTQNTNPVNYFI